MSANINDKFNKASNMGGSYPPVATVTAARSTGGSTLTCDSLAGWATDTPVHFSTFKLNSDGTVDTTTQTDWKGIVVSNTITEMTRLAGAADSGNASGDKVELNPTIGWVDDLMSGILVSHKQDGKLKDGIVKAVNIDFTTLLNILHPVGSYYETSDTSFNPNTAWGGTWVEDSYGRVTVAYQSDQALFDTVGGIGGEIEHTLTIDEMPSHTHTFEYGTNTAGAGQRATVSSSDGPHHSSGVNKYTGGGQAHNNLQPYIVVKRWHRTA